MSDRIAVMNGGRFEQIGAPEEIYEHPTTRFAAQFIGQSNIIEGHGALQPEWPNDAGVLSRQHRHGAGRI